MLCEVDENFTTAILNLYQFSCPQGGHGRGTVDARTVLVSDSRKAATETDGDTRGSPDSSDTPHQLSAARYVSCNSLRRWRSSRHGSAQTR